MLTSTALKKNVKIALLSPPYIICAACIACSPDMQVETRQPLYILNRLLMRVVRQETEYSKSPLPPGNPGRSLLVPYYISKVALFSRISQVLTLI